jgi:hypothetical protein
MAYSTTSPAPISPGMSGRRLVGRCGKCGYAIVGDALYFEDRKFGSILCRGCAYRLIETELGLVLHRPFDSRGERVVR